MLARDGARTEELNTYRSYLDRMNPHYPLHEDSARHGAQYTIQ